MLYGEELTQCEVCVCMYGDNKFSAEIAAARLHRLLNDPRAMSRWVFRYRLQRSLANWAGWIGVMVFTAISAVGMWLMRILCG